MEPYDALPQPDPYSPPRSAFERLISTLAGGPATDMSHDELEEHVEQSGRELLRQLMQDHLDLRTWKEEEAVRTNAKQLEVIGPEEQRRTWREMGHRRWLTCVFGPVRVNRIAYRGRGVANVHPADETLSLPAGRHSRGLARLAVLEAVRGSFDQAAAAVERRRGKALGKRRLKELVVASAVDVADYYTVKIPPVHPRDAAGHTGRRQGRGDASTLSTNAQDLLAVHVGGRLGVPQSGEVTGQRHELVVLGGGEPGWPAVGEAAVSLDQCLLSGGVSSQSCSNCRTTS